VRELFDRAADLPHDQRTAFLAKECSGDEELRADVSDLLQAITRSGDLFDSAVAPAIHGAIGDSDVLTGTRLGPYEIVDKLGEGGMGQVFRARRDDGVFQKEVAIKIVPSAFASPALVERFRAERRILAGLDHANIARVLDGGSTPNGAPYLVMEYVPGLPLLEHCEQQGLSLRDRVRLFRSLCDAVQYAHENLVVHRDLKPANVIVTSEGIAKLLDFGIAKLLEPSPVTGAQQTRPFERMMTPEYASPEQIRGEAVTTATDVYSLGAMLYELLAKRRPFSFRNHSLGEMERAVCEQDAPPLGRVHNDLAGDLENIVGKAMQKLPALRYRSAGQLADDLGRYLDGFPVQARPDSTWYKTGKFLRRHKLAMGALGAGLLSLAVFVILLVKERNTTERERAAAEQVVRFLVGSFSVADPSNSAGKVATARDILDNGVARVEAELKEQPEIMGRMLSTMGEVYGVIGEQKLAQRLLERSVAMPGTPLQHALALKRLGIVQTANGEWAAAERSLRGAVTVLKDNREVVTVNYADALSALAANLRTQGKLDDAEATVQQALALMRRMRGEQHPDTAECLGIWAQIRYDRQDGAGALERNRQALTIEEKALGTVHRRVALRLNLIAANLLQLRDFKSAEQTMLRALEIFRKLYGDKQQGVATAWNDLSVIYSRQGKYEEAAQANTEALKIYRGAYGDHHPFVAAALTNLAQIKRRQGDVMKASELTGQALESARQSVGPDKPEYAFAAYLAGVLAIDRGLFRESEQHLREAALVRSKSQGVEHDSVLVVEGYLAIALQAKGEIKPARAIYERMVSIAEKRKQAGSLSHVTGLVGMAETSADAGNWTEVDATLQKLQALKVNAPSRARIALVEARWHWAARRRKEAEAALRRAESVSGLDAALWRSLAARGLARLNASAEPVEWRQFAAYVPASRMFE
jgi:serine/threonine-protein kinase